MTALQTATQNVSDILKHCFKHDGSRKVLLVYDTQAELTRLLTDAYRAALPDVPSIDFDKTSPADIIETVTKLSPGDLVIMVQSTNFRLAEYRFRIELFQRGIAVIEHVHLDRITQPEQIATYVDALAYDTDYYHTQADALKQVIDNAKQITVHCAGTELRYDTLMEDTKRNIGDYAGMKNVGGTFPIGEVFSEPKDFAGVNGEAMIFGFAGKDHIVQIHKPFKIVVREGLLVSHEGPASFQEVLDQISADERIMVREFGIGLNRAMGPQRIVDDITAFERQRGLHFSLGEKHGVYKKPGMAAKKTHFHVDIFVDVERIEADGKEFFRV